MKNLLKNQHYLEGESHAYALKCETLFDKAMMSYATKLEQGVQTVDYRAEGTETPQASDFHGRDDHPTPNYV